MPEVIGTIPADRLEAVAIVLDSAADVLETEGWAQGLFVSKEGGGRRYCALGAMRKACGILEDEGYIPHDVPAADRQRYMDAKLEMERCLMAANPAAAPWQTRIHNWNDDTERTKEQVVRAFRNCASRVREDAEAAK